MKKTVLITGANRSIGYEVAKQLLAKDYFVYIGSRDLIKGNEAVAQLKAAGFNDVDVLQIDVADKTSVDKAAKTLAEKIKQLDVLINNAGILGAMPQNASEISLENIRNVYETNFFGVIQTTQAFIPLLKQSPAPRIVNVSSDLGSFGNHTNPAYEYYHLKALAYCSSKIALNAFTVMLAHDFKDTDFKVNSVNPGYTATEFNNFSGYKTIEAGAEPIIKYATIDSDGPTGKFFSDYGETPW
ncbi:SDR family oxidoreductase [Chitinophagaceae bacterium LWZ2-11]